MHPFVEIFSATEQLENNDNQFVENTNNNLTMFEDGESTHVENNIASISTRTTHIVHSPNNQLTTRDEIPRDYKLDMKPFIKRPFWLGTASWPETAPQYSLLQLPVKDLPADVILSNKSLKQAVKVGSLMKPSLKIHVSLNGTLTHAGCLLVGILPPGIDLNSANVTIGTNFVNLVNTLLSGPHVRLFANEATSAVLEVPWYCNTDMCESYIEDYSTASLDEVANTPLILNFNSKARSAGSGCYASIAALVLNPLRPGTAATPLTLVLEAIFDEFLLAVPTPRFLDDADWVPQSGKSFLSQATTGLLDLAQASGKALYPVYGDAIDTARGLIKRFTGLHNPNHPTINQRMIVSNDNFHNATDVPQFFERLDPLNNFNRVYKEPVFGSKMDEMSIKYICSKKQYIGTFEVSASLAPGTLLFSRPISPNQGGSLGAQPYYVQASLSQQVRVHANNIELMHAMHRFWRGGLDVEIESVMNNKSHCKLKIIKYYNPSQRILEDTPTMQSLSNAPSQLVEFSAGAQKYCVDLPYLHRNELMPCCEDYTSEGLMHGVYLIYLAQPLIIGDGSPTTVSFNVYMSGSLDPNQGLQFYGYINKEISLASLVPTSQDMTWAAQSSQSCMPSVKPMNEPQDPEETIVDIYPRGVIEHPNHFSRLVPNYDIRPLIRRMYKVYQLKQNLNAVNCFSQGIVLSNIISETYPNTGVFEAGPSPTNNIGLLAGMYYGKAGTGFKMRIDFDFYNNLEFAANAMSKIECYYVPPTTTVRFPTLTTPLAYAANFVNPANFNTLTSVQPDTTRTLRVIQNGGKAYVEFFVPDVSAFKFIGSPSKFYKSTDTTQLQSPTSDLGTIFYRIRGEFRTYGTVSDQYKVNVQISVGLSDETRFGFHCIAPIFVAKAGSRSTYWYLNPNGSRTNPISLLPLAMYKGHPNAA